MKFLVLIAALAISACSERPGRAEVKSPQDQSVSIVHVLSKPEDFDGQTIRVVGYLQLEFETYALWLHREDRVHWLLPNRIDLEASACAEKAESVNESYVLLEGTFVILNKGTNRERHLLQNVSRCQFWTKAK